MSRIKEIWGINIENIKQNKKYEEKSGKWYCHTKRSTEF